MLSKIMSIAISSFMLNLAFASEACVKEGQIIQIYPGAPKSCCEGLKRILPKNGVLGSGGKCIRPGKGEEKECVGAGKSIVIHPDSPRECCPGLKRLPPPPGMLGTAGKCVEDEGEEEINECVPAGESIVIYPNAPQECCPGAKKVPPKKGILGIAGSCIIEKDGINTEDDSTKSCVRSGKSILIYPGSPRQCCPGLRKVPPVAGIMGSAGRCIPDDHEIRKCVGEGRSIVIYPGAPRKCCKGLELQRPEPGVLGTGGVCVESSYPAPVNVNDSRLSNKKDSEDIKADKSKSIKTKAKQY